MNRTILWALGVGLAVAVSGPARADLDEFFTDLAAAGTQVPATATLTHKNTGASFTTGQFGEANIGFDDSVALGSVNDGLIGQGPSVPIGASVSAFTYAFDPVLNVFQRSTESLGPLLSERAQTVGRGKLNIALSVAHIDFDVFEGDHLSSLEVPVAGTKPFAGPNASFTIPAANTPVGGQWRVGSVPLDSGDLDEGGKFQGQFTNTSCAAVAVCNFAASGFSGTTAGGSYDVDFVVPEATSELDADIRATVTNLFASYGVTDRIDVGVVVPILHLRLTGKVTTRFSDGSAIQVSDRDSDTGIGDIILRAKALLLETEMADIGARVDLWLPTGDEDDLMGFGDPAYGGTLIASKTFGRFTPHANIGILLRGGGKSQHSFRYTAGLDYRVTDSVSLSGDLIVREKITSDGNGDRLVSLATGAKFNPWRRLVFTTNLVWKLNNQGLRATVIPSLGVEYTF